jgi:16S rRNA (cytosine1402-N4)-methyltransferase
MNNTYHTPILVNEVLNGLHVTKGKIYIDATLGGGGHTTLLLRTGAKVLGIDADWGAIEYTRKRLHEELPEKEEGKDYRLVHGNFRNIYEIAKDNAMPAGRQ